MTKRINALTRVKELIQEADQNLTEVTQDMISALAAYRRVTPNLTSAHMEALALHGIWAEVEAAARKNQTSMDETAAYREAVSGRLKDITHSLLRQPEATHGDPLTSETNRHRRNMQRATHRQLQDLADAFEREAAGES
ncbi:hypothetical protein [Streptomyces yaizuensis]|uniref:Uncharacterized protein n=1 Tax=Streptomyces yaizuensis TaxID=2989713 RepID=A0AA86IVD8_9ACTN|nr:hypothetical protein [Streptomyces sp. YSPA8]BDT39511.1 hypothetical protein SYYSPA8_36965 [Streptomyces sp. YSPA8]